MRRLALLLVLMATTASVGLPSSAAQPEPGPPPGSLPAYLRLASRWRRGDPSVVRELQYGWHILDLGRAAAELARAKGRLSERPVPGTAQIDVRLAESAVLMHTTAALVAFREQGTAEAEAHVSAAVSDLDVVHLAASQPRPGEPPLRTRIDPPLFYAGFAAACLRLGDLAPADDLAGRGLRRHPTDPRLLHVAGCVKEALAAVHAAYGRSGEAQQARREAERLLRDAVSLAPDDADARLRLGRVLLERDQPLQARPLLESVRAAGDARLRYLAWLSLGEMHQRQRAWSDAVAAYGEAIREQPDNQAARLGLAALLELASGPAAARPLVMATLALSGRPDRHGDPWWTYPLGPYEFASRTLETLQEAVRAP